MEWIGQIIGDRYQVQHQLGKKSGRRTLLATDLQTGEAVVLKVLTFGHDFEWADLRLFEREAETLQSLAHPAIPTYLRHFELDTPDCKGFVLVQSYISATSLEEQVKSGRTFSEADLKELAIALLNILDYLHNRQPPVVHRDIKPSNVLLGDRTGNSIGQVYLVDFGSVQTLASREGGTMTIVGTYGYMPPEQFGSRTVPASDLYSLGATLIYLATGQHPADLPQTDLRIDFARAAHLSPAMTRWLKAMTEPSLNRRFSSAQEALVALDQPLRAGGLALNQPPPGSRVVLKRDAAALEIVIPPPGWSSEVVLLLPFAIAWNAFVLLWSRVVFFGGSLGVLLFLFSLPFWAVGAGMVWRLLSALLCRTHLHLTADQVAVSYALLGLEFSPQAPLPSAAVHKILRTGGRDWANAHIRPALTLMVGTRKIQVGQSLSEVELDWLAHEISEWLGIVVTREP